MGAQLSKGGVAVEGNVEVDPAAAKANGQENGHVKTNGDVLAKPDKEVAPVDGNGAAEPAKEGAVNGAGDAIEPAPAAEGEAAKTEDEANEQGKKKKKFSLKNSFKFKGISLKKSKKQGSEEAKEDTAVMSPSAEDKPEENGHTTKDDTPAPEAKEGETAEAAPSTEAAAAPEGEAQAEEALSTQAVAPAAKETLSTNGDTKPAAPEGDTKAE